MDGDITLRLTPRVSTVLKRAEEMAKAAGHDYIGTEHLQLALIDVGGGVASEALRELDVTQDVVRWIRDFMASESYTNP